MGKEAMELNLGHTEPTNKILRKFIAMEIAAVIHLLEEKYRERVRECRSLKALLIHV